MFIIIIYFIFNYLKTSNFVQLGTGVYCLPSDKFFCGPQCTCNIAFPLLIMFYVWLLSIPQLKTNERKAVWHDWRHHILKTKSSLKGISKENFQIHFLYCLQPNWFIPSSKQLFDNALYSWILDRFYHKMPLGICGSWLLFVVGWKLIGILQASTFR